MIAIHLVVTDADSAARWYSDALGAVETSRLTLPDGTLLTVELRLADTVLAVAGEMPGRSMRAPVSLDATSAAFHLDVPDADASFQRAVDAGATVYEPLWDAFWGDRTGQILDPFGHRWAFDQHVRDVPTDEIASAAAALFT
ncbi:VOC family protein [Cryptosporangium phraense]|nr:VOC family protein [Cryptosporangium phraense]